MALTVTHPFVCALADDPVADAAGEVVPSDWNADHTIAVTSLTIATGTITASEPVLDLSQTWDNAAVTFAGIKLDVTNTASAAASMLADWQIGGASHFQWLANTFRVYGTYTDSSNYVRASLASSSTAVTLAAETAGTGADNVNINITPAGTGSVVITNSLSIDGTTNSHPKITRSGNSLGCELADGSDYCSVSGGAFYAKGGGLHEVAVIRGSGLKLGAANNIRWSSTSSYGGTPDLFIERDAAAVLAQRNDTTAQTLRVYGTYTDSSNYVRASLASSSTAVTLAAETAGTGADNVPVNLTPAGTEGVVIGNFAQFTEMTAPAAGAANTARLFCEDNGSGKTRLMVQFASGAAQQIAIEP